MFNKYWNIPPSEILPNGIIKGRVGTPYEDYSGVQLDFTPEQICAELMACGIMCYAGDAVVGPGTIYYPFNLCNLKDYSKLQRASNALGARLRVNAIISKCEYADFAVSIPRRNRALVPLTRCLNTMSFDEARRESPSTAILGLNTSNNTEFVDIAKMPHLLIAGASGSGKTVAMHTIITSLLFAASPNEVQFVMIDPKQIELRMYKKLPHLMTPIVTDVNKAVLTLEAVCRKMDERYKSIKKGYSGFSKIIVVIDELADLMLTSKKLAETPIVRIAQLGRAAGIHLIVATQRPMATVITGLIKANMPARLALTMASWRDAGVMEVAGADKLSGYGDALYQSPNHTIPPVRLQCAYTSEHDIRATVKWWTSRKCSRTSWF